MTADITLKQLWFNKSLMDFFFRKRAQRTLVELVYRAGGRESEDAVDALQDGIDRTYDSIEEFEDHCYNAPVDEILETLGYEVV